LGLLRNPKIPGIFLSIPYLLPFSTQRWSLPVEALSMIRRKVIAQPEENWSVVFVILCTTKTTLQFSSG
jgi:hypothetical protein